jgi:hypothetical protein
MSSDTKIKTLENQKVIADTISVPLSKEDLELLIDSLSDVSITNKQAISIFQKLNKGLETLENKNV